MINPSFNFVLALSAFGALSACGSSSSPEIVQFGQPTGQRINLDSYTTRTKTDDNTVSKPTPDFWLKAADQADDEFYVRYGNNVANSTSRTNHRINLTDRSYRGTQGRFGSATFDENGGPDTKKQLENDVTSRTMSVFDVTTDDISHGMLFNVDVNPRGTFHNAHAYAGGRPASNVPSEGTFVYTGVFLGNIAEVGATPTTDLIELDASLEIDFAANTFTGELGTGGTVDVQLSGTRFASAGGPGGRQLVGTAEIATTTHGLAIGQDGPIDGRIFGDGASAAAGSISIEDGSGGARKVFVGSFGVQQ